MAAYNLVVVAFLCFACFLGVNGQWMVNDTKTKNPCLVVDMHIEFDIAYTAVAEPSKRSEFPLMPDSTVDESSNCSMLVLNSPTNSTPVYKFSMTFDRDVNNYFVKLLSLTPTFEDQKTPVTREIKGPLFPTSLNTSYYCMSEVNQTDDSDTPSIFAFSDTQLQAYNVPKDGSFSIPEECLADMTTTMGPSTTQAITTTMAPTQAPAPTKPWAVTDTYQPDQTCLLADFGAQFVINYKTTDNKTATAMFDLPVNATVDEDLSSCASNETTAKLVLMFNTNDTLVLNFALLTKDEKKYELNEIILNYLVAPPVFNNSVDEGTMQVTSNNDPKAFKVEVGNYYRCYSTVTYSLSDKDTINMDNAQFQAFQVVNNTFSEKGEICDEDMTTTSLPTTAVTMTVPSPTRAPAAGQGNWNVADKNGIMCMIVHMTLLFKINYTAAGNKNKTAEIAMPITASTNTSECGGPEATEATLRLTDFYGGWSLELHFVKSSNGQNFSMLADDDKGVTYAMDRMRLNYTLDEARFPDPEKPGAKMIAVSNNTDGNYFNSSVKMSYTCNNQGPIMSADGLTIFDLSRVKIQPFALENDGKFGDAAECSADDKPDKTSNIVPIAVGCALAGLILIVLVAYLIGRRRNQSGYQSV